MKRFSMNWRAIFAIMRKDVTVVIQSKGVLIPLIIVPLILTTLMPAIFATLPRLIGALDSMAAAGSAMREMDEMLRQMPPQLRAEMIEYTAEQRLVVLMTVYYLAPSFSSCRLLLPALSLRIA